MQALSGMRRNSTDIQLLKSFFWVALLFVYQASTTVFIWAPPLIGLFFAYMIILTMEKQKRLLKYDIRWYFSIVYIIFVEQVHGFALFSTILAFIVFYYFICDWLVVTFKSRAVLLIFFVSNGYLGTYLISSLLLYIKNLPILNFGYEYFVYTALESALAIVLFKERVK